MGNGQASVNGTFKSSEHLVASGGPGQAGVQVAGECSWLPVDALHVELVASDLHLALVHLIQAKFVQQLRKQVNTSFQLFTTQPTQERCTNTLFSSFDPPYLNLDQWQRQFVLDIIIVGDIMCEVTLGCNKPYRAY